MIRIVRVDHGRDVSPDLRITATTAIVCDDCGAEGPKELEVGCVETSWTSATVKARANSDGWTHRYERVRAGSLERNICPTCSARSKTKPGEQVPMFGGAA